MNRIAHSRTCDRRPGITRERLIGGPGTRTCPTDFPRCGRTSGFRAPTSAESGTALSLGGMMSDPLYRAERCRDLAEEYRSVAALCASTEMPSYRASCLFYEGR